MNGHGGSRRAIVIEKFSIHLVVSGEVVHADEICRKLNDVPQIGSGAPQNVANIFDYRAGLGANVEPGCAERVDFGAGDAVIGAAGAGS